MSTVRNAIRAALYLDGDWRNISSDILQRQDIEITYGYQSEDASPRPSTCTLLLRNTSGDYSIRNPMGRWYGHIGRNNPLQLWLALAEDACGTAVINGWGSTHAATSDATAGLVALPWTSVAPASNYAKTGGIATHALAAAGDIRLSYLADIDQRDVEIRCTVTVPTSNVTGGPIGAANLIVHGQDTSTYYMLRLRLEPDESLTVDFWANVAGTAGSITGGAGATTVTGITHTSSQALRVAFGCEGRTLRCKVWPASSAEPYEWTRVFVDEDTARARPLLTGTAGWVGIRSSLITGNTNGPLTISYDDIEVRSYRFSGEVATWPAEVDLSGVDKVVPITAAGLRRRKSQGEAPLDSALRRMIQTDSVQPIAYWPLEDQQRAVPEEVLAVAGNGSLRFVPPTAGTTVGRITWASDSDLPGSLPLPELTGGGSLVGHLDPVTSATAWYAVWAERMSATDGSFSLLTTVAAHIYLSIVLDPATPTVLNVYLTAPAVSSALILTHTFASRSEVEEWHLFEVDAEQNGTGVDFLLLVDGAVVDTHHQASLTLNPLASIQLSSVTNASRNTSVGHVAVYNSVPTTSEIYEAFGGNTSETALQRMQRLCREESVEIDWWGVAEIGTYPPALGDTPEVGPQRANTFLGLMDDCQRVDLGLLHEQRSMVALHYRTRRSLYTQDPWVTLDYAAHELGGLRAQPDDRLTRNLVRAQRIDGGDYTHEVTTGPLSTQAPEDGGAGLYDERYSVNAQTDLQLPGIAEWRAHIGTVDEDRYTGVLVRLVGGALDDGTAPHNAIKKALLDLNVGDKLVVTNATTLYVYDDIEQIVIGYGERLNAYAHEIRPVCVPASPFQVLVLDDTDYSRADSGSSSLTNDITSAANSFQVTTTDPGDLWTTDASEFPLDIRIGGERITISNITGSSSPQTFTASARSVNGVVKGHSAGAEVHVADPVYLGL